MYRTLTEWTENWIVLTPNGNVDLARKLIADRIYQDQLAGHVLTQEERRLLSRVYWYLNAQLNWR